MHWAPSGSAGEEITLWKSPSTPQSTIDGVLKEYLTAMAHPENQERVLKWLRDIKKRGNEIFHNPELYMIWLRAFEVRSEAQIAELKSESQDASLPVNKRAGAIFAFENATREYTRWLKNLTELHAKAMNDEDLFNAVNAIA